MNTTFQTSGLILVSALLFSGTSLGLPNATQDSRIDATNESPVNTHAAVTKVIREDGSIVILNAAGDQVCIVEDASPCCETTETYPQCAVRVAGEVIGAINHDAYVACTALFEEWYCDQQFCQGQYGCEPMEPCPTLRKDAEATTVVPAWEQAGESVDRPAAPSDPARVVLA